MGDTQSALLAQHLMLAGTEQLVAHSQELCGLLPPPAHPHSAELAGAPQHPLPWARERLRKRLREVWRMQGRQKKGELQIAGVWKTLQS